MLNPCLLLLSVDEFTPLYLSLQTERSDDRSHNKIPQQRTFINFVSAKQRTLSDKASNKTRVRGRDLLQMIDLDVASYNMFDLPPVKEYDLYIRNFGRSDTTQVCAHHTTTKTSAAFTRNRMSISPYLFKQAMHLSPNTPVTLATLTRGFMAALT